MWFLDILDCVGNLRRLIEHGCDRAIFFFGEAHRIFYRLVRNVSSYSINQTDFRIYGRRGGGTLPFSSYFEAGEWFAFLAQDTGDIVAGASAQADQNQFHGAVAGFTGTIDYDPMATAGLPQAS